MAIFDIVFQESIDFAPQVPDVAVQGGANIFDIVLEEIGELLPLPPIPFTVLIAIPLNSNTIRVFFSEEPRHQSSLSANDVLNRLNWEVQVQTGPASVPVVTLIENVQPQPAQFPMTFPEAWSVDVRTDRQLRFGTTYLTIAGVAIEAVDGDSLQPDPDDRDDHPGIV